jgi:hypothetical protein
MMASYSWLTFGAAKSALSARLADPGFVFWANQECGLYIQTALRMFNTLTGTWKTDFVYTDGLNIWNSLATLQGSPRLRTLKDTDAYTLMEYMLLEPATGGVWTGTPQFAVTDLSQALQSRRDEVIQVSNCNQSLMTGIPLTPNTTRASLPDTVIEAARMRYLPVSNPYLTSGSTFVPGVTGVTLYRDDTVAQEWYESPLYQQSSGVPQTFMLSSEPPFTFDVDIPPNLPGTYEAVVLSSGGAFIPPSGTLLNIPDDFMWVLIWGALADVLGRDSEATDRPRAAFCAKRYMDGLNLLLNTPWVMLTKVNGVAVTPDSFVSADRYTPEWDSSPTTFGPFVVTGGIDFLGAPVGTAVGVTCLGNAPVPVADDDFVQVSRSNWDTVLDLAQVFASFKMGGAEFQAALAIEARAIQACSAENVRLKSTGSFADVLMQRGQAEDRDQERYSTANQKPRK